MANQYTIHIPEPCRQNWHEMAPEGDGRYCSNCAKTVIDFANLTDVEIISHFQLHGNLCGRFREIQLNRLLEVVPRRTGKRNKFHEILATALLLFTVHEAGAVQPATKAFIVQSSKTAKAATITVDNKDSVGLLTGRVIEKNGLEPLENATVFNRQTHRSVSADSLGRFSINASVGDNLEIKYIGFLTLVYVVKDLKYTEIELQESMVLGRPIVVIPKKQLLAYRIRRFFHFKRWLPEYKGKKAKNG